MGEHWAQINSSFILEFRQSWIRIQSVPCTGSEPISLALTILLHLTILCSLLFTRPGKVT